MESELQNNTVSSTSSQNYEQLTTATNETSSVQVNTISSTTSSDAEAIMLSLIDDN
jgi:hypothetical protein